MKFDIPKDWILRKAAEEDGQSIEAGYGGSLTEKKSLVLRHYGDPAFDRAKFVPIKDHHFIKPQGGLWTSPVDSDHSWRHWCEAEDFCRDFSVYFDINFTGNVLTIDHPGDLPKLGWVDASEYFRFPLFEPLVLMGVDAIHLTASGERSTRFSRPYSLCGWDCETVLVMNPDCLSPS